MDPTMGKLGLVPTPHSNLSWTGILLCVSITGSRESVCLLGASQDKVFQKKLIVPSLRFDLYCAELNNLD